MNKNLAVAETANDEQLLDQLVQDLFLEHLRRELDIQRKSIDDSNDILFNLDRKFAAEFKKLTGQLETICDTLGEQTCELNDAKGDAQTHYRSLLNSLAQYRTDIAALYDLLHKNHQEQGEQLQRVQEQLSQQSTELQAQSKALASLTEQHVLLSRQQMAIQEQQFSATFGGMQAQNMTLASFTEQNMSQHQQLLTLEDRHHAELNINRRWGKFVAGFTLVNTIILVGIATVFIIKLGV
ncbi:TPA: hypothetical protein MYO83_000539 [Klebsiella michiganensis]|nr:hypothetical protein [Klebsiella michiganensis]HCB1844959.1 hypothetical protein [Klebsiella oxytoca]